jgi:hypothetical protein
MLHRLSSVLIAMLVLSLLVSACGMMKKKSQKDDLSKKNADYVLRMKYGKFVGASLHYKQDLREPFLERFEDWDTLKVADFSLARLSSEFDGKTARKTAYYTMEYYLLTDMKLRKQKVKLVWELPPEIKGKSSNWRIVNQFPELEGEKK